MSPAPAQPQPPLSTSPTFPSLPAPSTFTPSPKPRLLLYLVGGLTLLTIITIVLLKIIPPLLRQKTSPPNSQNPPITQTPSKTVETNSWRTGEAIDFKFQYPQGWHALSGVSGDTRYFKLDPEPLYAFPEYIPFIEGKTQLETEKPNLKTEINYFLSATYPKIEKLDWKNDVFPSECYRYDTMSDKFGELKGNIECLLEITVPANLPDEQLARYIYEFSVLNYGNPIEKIDPDLSITKRFIESIHP